MRHLTIEQREALGAHIDGRTGALREQIATVLKQPGNSETIHLANHLAEIDDDAVADLETSLDIATIERGPGGIARTRSRARAPATTRISASASTAERKFLSQADGESGRHPLRGLPGAFRAYERQPSRRLDLTGFGI